MTKAELKEILDRVLTWPPERQADVAHVVELMEEQDSSALRPTDEQAAEVRRRLETRVWNLWGRTVRPADNGFSNLLSMSLYPS